jgi:ABC-type Fe3+/spermidine/putrescine transport system ATPase subunit
MSDPRPAAPAALSLKNISRRFGDYLAVDDVSLTVAPGELVALIGASGSGKTTTLRIVAGYEAPDSGSILLGDTDITRLPPQKRGFGMVFQHYALFPQMPVVENVAFGLEARGVGKEERLRKAREILESVGLEGRADRAVQNLSGGEQQRVALARALIIEPKALLLDEPLSNLDPTLRQTTREDLRAQLHSAGVPALFVTHDQEDAFAVADRIALLKKGKILQTGTPEELYNSPVSRDVAAFIGRAVIMPAEVNGSAAVLRIGEESLLFQVTRAPGAPAVAEKPSIVLRPHSLRIAENGVHGLSGKIAERRFTGSLVMYRVRLADGTVVEVESKNHSLHENDAVVLVPGEKAVAMIDG